MGQRKTAKIKPVKKLENTEESRQNQAIQAGFWSCYPDLNWVYQANNATGYVFVVVGDGFGGKGTMKLIVSMDTSGSIIESRILEESETQGLGAKVANEDFRKQFSE